MSNAVAPKTVTITGPSEAKVNDTVSLECTTSNSNPESRIAWMLDGRDVRENGSRITTSPDGGWISYSNLTTVIQATGRNLTVSCLAIVAGMSQRVAETKIISVVCKSSVPCRIGGNGHYNFKWNPIIAIEIVAPTSYQESRETEI